MNKKIKEKILRAEEVAIELYNLVSELYKEDIELNWSIINMLESLEDLTKNTYQCVSALQLSARLNEQIKRLEDEL